MTQSEEANYQKAIQSLSEVRDALLDVIVEQKAEIKRLKAELAAAKEKRHE